MRPLGKVYFASDFHLGAPGLLSSREREKTIVRWLNDISKDADQLFLVGDVFDFWFDYRRVVPRGYTRLLGKLAELRDGGVEIFFFTGNHDLWMKDYFLEELNIPILHEPVTRTIGNMNFYIGHGDGLGPGDHGYKRLKKLFRNPLAQFAFRWIHPDVGIGLADYFSRKSRKAQAPVQNFLGVDREWLIAFAEEECRQRPADYFIFGHRHLPIDYTLSNQRSRYVNLGDWLSFQSYAEFDGTDLKLRFYEREDVAIYI